MGEGSAPGGFCSGSPAAGQGCRECGTAAAQVRLRVKVTNTGAAAGKEVVQAYCQAPAHVEYVLPCLQHPAGFVARGPAVVIGCQHLGRNGDLQHLALAGGKLPTATSRPLPETKCSIPSASGSPTPPSPWRPGWGRGARLADSAAAVRQRGAGMAISSTWLSPGASSFVFAKPQRLRAGFPSAPWGDGRAARRAATACWMCCPARYPLPGS